MQCEETRSYFADHLIGRLAASIQADVHTHLASCTECRDELAEFEGLQTLLRAAVVEPANTDSMRSRFAALQPSTIEIPARKWRISSRPLLVAFAMMLLAAAVFAAQKTGVWVAVSSLVPLQSPPQTAPAAKPAVKPADSGVVTGRVFRSVLGEGAGGVRVAVMAAMDNGTPELVRSVITDAGGRYRLEDIPPGRYYVVAGSVDVPTYFPNTSIATLATVFAIRPGGTIDGINFEIFQPARTAAQEISSYYQSLAPAFLSGVVQYPDGTPAAGFPVFAVPVDAASSLQVDSAKFLVPDFANTSTTIRAQYQEMKSRLMKPGYRRSVVEMAMTDEKGRYRIQVTQPDTYFIIAGFADSPAYYPDTHDLNVAKTVAVASGASLDALDLKASPPPAGVAVQGRFVAGPGMVFEGGSIELRRKNSSISLFPPRPNRKVKVNADGTFEVPDVTNGSYTLEGLLRGASPVSRDVVVNGLPISGLQFPFTVANVMGSVVMEDGSAVSDPQLGEIEVTAVSNPNVVLTTFVKIDRDGGFRDVFGPDEYRFRVGRFSQDYVIRSVKAGTKDLIKETFEVRNAAAIHIEIRVARNRSTVSGIRGSVINGTTGAPTTAERVQLCCFPSGPAERIFTPVHSDGSYEFTGVPPGHYSAELRGKTQFEVANPGVDVTGTSMSEVKLQSLSPLIPVTVLLNFGNSETVPAISEVRVVFAEENGDFRAAASPINANPIQVRPASNVALPINANFTFRILNLPDGYAVQSIAEHEISSFERPQTGEVNRTMDGGRLPAFSPLTRRSPNSVFEILISLKKK